MLNFHSIISPNIPLLYLPPQQIRNHLPRRDSGGRVERPEIKRREDGVCKSEWKHRWDPSCAHILQREFARGDGPMGLTDCVFQCPALACKAVLLDFSSFEMVNRSGGIYLRVRIRLDSINDAECQLTSGSSAPASYARCSPFKMWK
jgi:hypothetical protein